MKAQRKTRSLFSVLFALIVVYVIYVYALFPIYAHAQQDYVREAVLRYYVRSSRGNLLFVSLEGQSPGNGFMRRFSANRNLVRKTSEGSEVQDPFGDVWGFHYLDNRDGRQGQWLDIGRIDWRWPMVAKVAAGHAGYSEEVTVTLTFRGWIAAKKRLTKIA